jgi:hypothetical protein
MAIGDTCGQITIRVQRYQARSRARERSRAALNAPLRCSSASRPTCRRRSRSNGLPYLLDRRPMLILCPGWISSC